MKNGNLASWSIEHKQIIYFFMFLCLVAGIYSYNILGRSEDPVYTVKQMVISAAWPGATAKEMEMQVTDKIEKEAQTLPDIDYVTSYSRPGQCVVNVYLKEHVPTDKVRSHWLELRNIVNDIKTDLPEGVYGPYFNDRFDDVYGNIYAITSESFGYEDMRKEAEEIKRIFYTVPDVKKVELIGVQPEKIYLEVSNDKLSQLGISLDTLASAIKSQSAVVPAGMAESTDNNVYLRLTGLPDTLKEIGSIPVNANGRIFRLDDIAKVTRGYADPPEPKIYFNGQPAIGISISMEDGGNNIRLGENLAKTVAQIENRLPLGFELHQVANQPEVVKNSIDEFTQSLKEAVIIVLAVSLFSLGKRCGYVISVCIPLVLLGTFIGMYALGIDLHKVSLGALIVALGMLVDDAIVVVELMEIKLAEGWERKRAAAYAFETCAFPLLTGTIITCVGFTPIYFSRGSVGEFAGSLFTVISLALMLSWVVSATVAPVLGYEWVHPKKIAEGSAYTTPFYQKFRSLLTWSLAHRLTVIAVTIGIFFGSLFLSKFINKEFFPPSVRPELLTELNLPEGTSIKTTEEIALKITSEIKDDPDIASIATYIGESAPRFVLVAEPVQPRENYAQLVILAKDVKAKERVSQKVSALINQKYPEILTYSKSISLGPPSEYPVMLRVSAPTDELAKRYAQKVREEMEKHPAVIMTRFNWMEKTGALKVEIDNDKLRQMGIDRQTVSMALQAELSGYTVAQYYEGDQAIDIVFRLPESDREKLSDLRMLTIPTPGGSVSLEQVANISYEAEDNMIWRRNLLPTVTVNAGISEGYTDNDVAQQIYDSLAPLREELPPGVAIDIGGPLENSNKALNYLIEPVPAMFIVMIILLIMQLKDVRKMIVIACTAPMGVIGVMIGLLLFGSSLGFLAELGILALTGIIIRNSVVLLDQIDQHLEAGMPPYEAVLESAIVRFRPIMLAALTTVLGLVPMFTNPFWESMAVAIACGLTGATLLTLVVLPVIYSLMFKITKP